VSSIPSPAADVFLYARPVRSRHPAR